MTTRRDFIKKSGLAAGLLTVDPVKSFSIHSKSRNEEEILGHGEYRYRMVRDWAVLDRIRYPLINCHEMVMDSRGRLVMIGDHPHHNVLIFDRSGKLLDAWGTAYPGGHGIALASEGGEDFLYLADSGWFMGKEGKMVPQSGRVSKSTLDGRTIFDIGHPQTQGAYEPGAPFRPTEVAVNPQNGDVYVADGYGSDYILQYDSKGVFIRKWGGHDNPDPNYNLHNAHGIALDFRVVGNPLLICTSRSENAFKFFTLDGRYVKTIHLPNLYVCRAVIDDTNLYAGVCWSTPREGTFDWLEHTGFVTVLEGDRVVSNPGGTRPDYLDGKLQPSYQLPSKPLLHGHDVCVDGDKNLYICQWNAHGSAPVKLERI
ncbi:twin-arginine translocation signal domain-containing protein [Algoriphagus sp. H41]|uniref:Twin-arginine translocation signal domain-containing protein n=1 Tax=Algoriphagus oliviformis TaxID=2811231 RepID=A0ABS3C8C2_9BACT|nr:twin-arginine translocation signal domain-containing protein [Algoriphagus oliviformis]MBN7813368.1 twin-arginine translocation signal domain-containing protein [Algoriphagus oliviformis]